MLAYFSRLRKIAGSAAFRWGRTVATAAAVALLGFLVSERAGDDILTSQAAAQFQARPMAPEFDTGMDWLNTETALSLADLRGRVVLLDFWTLC